MAKKRDQDTTATMKALMLYSLLLFSGKRYSLTELSKRLGCSKPTVIRLVDHIDLTRTAHVRVESEIVGKQKYYWAAAPAQKPNVTLGAEEIRELALCRDLLWHLLPRGLRDEVGQTIARTTVLLDDFGARDAALHNVAMQVFKGFVDYSPHEKTLRTIVDALHDRHIVELVYRAHDQPAGRAMAVAPLRLVAHRDTLYVLARREKDLKKKNGFYEPRLAIQRIESAACTDRTFPAIEAASRPEGYFGFMPGEPFEVVVEAEAQVAPYIRERNWSRDQEITELDGGRIRLRFHATSEGEVLSWVLGFAGQVRVVAPDSRREEIAACAGRIAGAHGGDSVA